MKQSGYLKRVQAGVRQQIFASRNVHTQMCLDNAMIAANVVFHMGPSRAEQFAMEFSRTLGELSDMTIEDMEYTKAKLDDRLRSICGDKFQPWEERYH